MTENDRGKFPQLGRLVDWPSLDPERYELTGRLGIGGMGSVFSASDRLLNREVAVKVVTLPAPEAAEFVAALAKEAKVLARLEHPGIVPIYDLGVLDDGRAYYVMRLVRGIDLHQFSKRITELGERLRVFERVCEAVAYAHSKGVIHRDLKPQNIMIGEFGEVLVMDWGIAVSTDIGGDRITGGTIGFMAPEQMSGVGRTDHRCDIYALGRVLGLLASRARNNRDFRTRRLTSIVNRATAERADDRYSTVDELGADISRLLSGAPVLAHRESVLERVGRTAHNHRIALGLVAAYVALRALILVATGS